VKKEPFKTKADFNNGEEKEHKPYHQKTQQKS
jgi:hypothetical protein